MALHGFLLSNNLTIPNLELYYAIFLSLGLNLEKHILTLCIHVVLRTFRRFTGKNKNRIHQKLLKKWI